MGDTFESDVRKVIARTYSGLSAEALQLATEAFLGYVDIATAIYDGLENEPERLVKASALTTPVERATFDVGQAGLKDNQLTSSNA